jgi:hypothetical protein
MGTPLPSWWTDLVLQHATLCVCAGRLFGHLREIRRAFALGQSAQSSILRGLAQGPSLAPGFLLEQRGHRIRSGDRPAAADPCPRWGYLSHGLGCGRRRYGDTPGRSSREEPRRPRGSPRASPGPRCVLRRWSAGGAAARAAVRRDLRPRVRYPPLNQEQSSSVERMTAETGAKEVCLPGSLEPHAETVAQRLFDTCESVGGNCARAAGRTLCAERRGRDRVPGGR